MNRLQDVYKRQEQAPMLWMMTFSPSALLRLVAVLTPTAMMAIGMAAVSYTHLDVYKRQCFIFAPKFSYRLFL